LGLVLVLLILLLGVFLQQSRITEKDDLNSIVEVEKYERMYWFKLHRKSNKEYLYYGESGKAENSEIVKVFDVKSGIPLERPTPLPQLLGKDYWLVTGKYETLDDPETAPYFLTLDVPVTENFPYGPEPYLECGGQCNWELPGAFGLHGNNGNPEKLSPEDVGSSGCIRHTVEDITYLYNLLTPENQEIRYYIEDV